MNSRTREFLRKTGWLFFVIFMVLGLALMYLDIQEKHEIEAASLQAEPVYETEEVTPVSDLVCINCHSELGDTGDDNLQVPGSDWFTSTHKEVGTTCSDCHGGDPTNQSDPMSGNFAGKPERNTIPEVCGNCHVDEYNEYKESIHNSYTWNSTTNETVIANVCTDCHGIHHIEKHNNPESPVYLENEPHTCAKCHETKYYSYQDTYHGAYLVLGGELVATCTDCHGYHGIRPTVDPESSVHPDNIPETCAECHGNELDVDIAQGYVHNEGELGEREDVYYILGFDLRELIPTIYKIITPLMVFGFIGLIILENIGPFIGERLKSWKKRKENS